MTANKKPIHFVLAGGTIVMGKNAGNNELEPQYDLRHLIVATAIREKMLEAGNADEKCRQALAEVAALKLSKDCEPKDLEASLLRIAQKNGVEFPSLSSLFRQYGVSPDVVLPFKDMANESDDVPTGVKYGMIDSIEYDVNIHHEPLQKRVNELMQDCSQEPVIVVGGTDSLEFYAPLLAKDLADRPDTSNNVLGFVSAMSCFEKDPLHIADLMLGTIKAAHKLSDKPAASNNPLGVYLFAPKVDKEGVVERIITHNMANEIIKISSELPNAFRSNEGKLRQTPVKNREVITPLFRPENHSSDTLMSGESLAPDSVQALAPIVAGTPPESVLAFMKTLLEEAKETGSFSKQKTLTIEYDPALVADKQIFAKMQSLARALNEKNVLTVVAPDMVPADQTAKRFTEKVDSISDDIQLAFMENSIAVEPGAIADVWAIHKIAPLHGKDDMLKSASENNLANQLCEPANVIGMRYIPDYKSFAESLDLAGKMFKNACDKNQQNQLVIEALPGFALPQRVQPMLQKLVDQGVEIKLSTKFAGREYEMPNGDKFTEGRPSNYASRGWLNEMNGVEALGTVPARAALASEMHEQAVASSR